MPPPVPCEPYFGNPPNQSGSLSDEFWIPLQSRHNDVDGLASIIRLPMKAPLAGCVGSPYSRALKHEHCRGICNLSYAAECLLPNTVSGFVNRAIHPASISRVACRNNSRVCLKRFRKQSRLEEFCPFDSGNKAAAVMDQLHYSVLGMEKWYG